MKRLNPKVMMFVFGITAIAAVSVFIMLYQGSPGPLSAAHAEVIHGSTIFSCSKCHADEGLMAGCLHCHVEIAGQLDEDKGYHAFLRKEQPAECEACHSEHFGESFPLINEASWKDESTNAFIHPHVEFKLVGKHTGLACEKCHDEKLPQPFALPDFPGHPRASTMLGLNQECISCHRDVHESGDKTRDCTKCHNQDAFKPAPLFNHDQYYVLEGPHAKAACAACHQPDTPPEAVEGERKLTFGPVKGKGCADCHESPHRFEQALQADCLACHLGSDSTWSMGQRGIDAPYHDRFGFKLVGAHGKVACAKCHAPELETYAERFPDPATEGYSRRNDQCSGCHKDPHDGQFRERYPSCAQCHTVDRFLPSTLGPKKHAESYPLRGGHLAVACNRCHEVDTVSEVRRFKGTTKSCKACHANPHGSQFDQEIAQNDCTACHLSDFSSFRILEYRHQNMRAFFLGKGHAEAACIKCHAQPASGQTILQYRNTPADCASCHADIHRGQFRRMGRTQCERCHGSFDKFVADRFDHDRDSKFTLDKAHVKVECKACHQPVPQPDGQSVVQYKPLTTKCEDCHGFQTK